MLTKEGPHTVYVWGVWLDMVNCINDQSKEAMRFLEETRKKLATTKV